MLYKNKKTGFVFESTSKCNGADWELLGPPVNVDKRMALKSLDKVIDAVEKKTEKTVRKTVKRTKK